MYLHLEIKNLIHSGLMTNRKTLKVHSKMNVSILHSALSIIRTRRRIITEHSNQIFNW